MTEKYGSVVVGVARSRVWRSLVLGRPAALCGTQQVNSFYLCLLACNQPGYESGSRGVDMLGLINEQN